VAPSLDVISLIFLTLCSQVGRAARYVWDLKQFLIYLIAYFVVQESFSAASTVEGILQNK
jgi:hypothetical protein